MDELLSKVKANLILEHTADDALLKSYITAAVSYAESYQHIPEGFYKENPTPAQFAMQPRPKQSARPATRLFRSPKNRPPAPSPAIRPVRSAPFVRQSSPVWKKSLRPATQK